MENRMKSSAAAAVAAGAAFAAYSARRTRIAQEELADREAAGSTADEAYVNGTPGGEKDKRPVN